ncbi:MAG: hypothetical protein QOG64_1777 [Acidimicrobiaceae bacterium]|nr:hypothetical protein [Acidimicrobiaceae bacterium]
MGTRLRSIGAPIAGAVLMMATLLVTAGAAAAAPAATTTTLASDANPAVRGQLVTLTAAVKGGSGVATGSVTFADGSTALATRTLDSAGKATFATNGLGVGSHDLSASYAGDSGHSSSQGDLGQTIAKAATVVLPVVPPHQPPDRTSFGASVVPVPPGAGTPTGSVVFSEGSRILGSATLSSGGGQAPSFSLSPGRHVVSASYGGDNDFQTSSAVVFDRRVGFGYIMAAADGGVFSLGAAGFFGSQGDQPLNSPVVAAGATPDREGYWLVAADGGVFAFGDAPFLGSMGATPLNQPITGMVPTPTGNGYWLVAADGGVFSFGDAVFLGSTGGLTLASPIVGMAGTPTGQGYWLVAADGGVFAFGDAPFLGSLGDRRLVRPVVGVAPSTTGQGYWLASADGGIFAFGDAPFEGSLGGRPLARPVVGIAANPTGQGYWLGASDGGVFAFGDAPFLGSEGDRALNSPVVALSFG